MLISELLIIAIRMDLDTIIQRCFGKKPAINHPAVCMSFLVTRWHFDAILLYATNNIALVSARIGSQPHQPKLEDSRIHSLQIS